MCPNRIRKLQNQGVRLGRTSREGRDRITPRKRHYFRANIPDISIAGKSAIGRKPELLTALSSTNPCRTNCHSSTNPKRQVGRFSQSYKLLRHNSHMLVTPLPGTSRENLQKTLQEMHSAVLTVWSGHYTDAQAKLAAYLEWTTTAIQHLGGQVTMADLDRLVLTPAYGRLLNALGTVTGNDVATQRTLRALVSLELDQRVKAFEAARHALDEQIARWRRDGAFVVADTSVYIEHEHKLEDLDLASLLPVGTRFRPVHLLVPMVTVDELDGLKNRASKPHARWRAGHTLAVFDRLFANGTGPATLRAAELSMAARQATYVRVLSGDRAGSGRPCPATDQRR